MMMMQLGRPSAGPESYVITLARSVFNFSNDSSHHDSARIMSVDSSHATMEPRDHTITQSQNHLVSKYPPMNPFGRRPTSDTQAATSTVLVLPAPPHVDVDDSACVGCAVSWASSAPEPALS